MKIRLMWLVLSSVSCACFADQSALTRQEVVDNMIQYEKAGFNPAHANPQTWVDDAQRAGRIVTERAQSHQSTSANNTAAR